ncbi:MAG: non-ribosomal peptide synthetase [Woeseiaceae bacterium]|nr:non-ribosomal peptide synthetase [Woeseiaceae bacterium]
MTETGTYRAARRILEVARSDPSRPALIIDGETWSYGELVAAASALASKFPATAEGDAQPITAVMAERHASSYVGILAARLAGHTYVPLNVNHPSQRNATILASSGAGRVICGTNARSALADILSAAGVDPAALPVVHCGDSKQDFATGAECEYPGRAQSLEDRAYILFTSGSTGNPKGVPIQNAQLEAYLEAAGAMVDVQPHDRFSQTFELTFDLSVHDLFLCWENGAALVVASEKELRMPADYIQRHHITCWFSVPSLAYQVRLQEDLRPGAFPSLRSSLFCGEALPTVVAREWAAAAPNSVVENWYGPTEATIACSRFVLSDVPIDDDTVPIGKAFDGMELLVLDASRSSLPVGEAGELFLAGAQVAVGYLNDPEKTAASFMTLPDGKKAYRTGDRAVLGEDGNVRFLGRVDNQVKVRGFRIELGEIEAVLRAASGGLNAVAMAWPGGAEIATSVVAALETDSADIDEVQTQAAAKLPDYMVPAMIFCVPEFPKNASGKVDRRGLAELLEQRAHQAADTSGLGDEAAFLLRSILSHAPLLGRDNIENARNLFDAGMDSIAFISFTTDVEHEFGLTLDQDTVIQLSEMSFADIVAEVRGETSVLMPGQADEAPPSFLDRMRKLLGIPRLIQKQRANRALQFIERFPAYLAEHGAPDVLAFGSSGTFRAIVPAEFEPAVAINAGFPAVNAFGMRMMCEYIRTECEKARVRVPLVIYEFDPMQVSTTPPSGDINLGPDFFEGNVISLRGKNTSLEFQWLADTRGAWNAPEEARQKQRKPNWVRERDRVIAGVYLGEVEFEPQAVEAWFAGARTLQSIADRVVCFLHPADREMTDELKDSCGGDALVNFTNDITAKLGIEVIAWESFDLEPGDYLDINHMNARGGREKLSRQLAAKVLGKSPVP